MDVRTWLPTLAQARLDRMEAGLHSGGTYASGSMEPPGSAGGSSRSSGGCCHPGSAEAPHRPDAQVHMVWPPRLRPPSCWGPGALCWALLRSALVVTQAGAAPGVLH